MSFFGSRDLVRLERRVDRMEDAQDRHFDKIEGLLADIRDEVKKHAAEANGHPPRVVWHGMTWPQIVGLGLVGVVLVLTCALVGINIFEVIDLERLIVQTRTGTE